jgi:hypothetical protein
VPAFLIDSLWAVAGFLSRIGADLLLEPVDDDGDISPRIEPVPSDLSFIDNIELRNKPIFTFVPWIPECSNKKSLRNASVLTIFIAEFLIYFFLINLFENNLFIYSKLVNGMPHLFPNTIKIYNFL